MREVLRNISSIHERINNSHPAIKNYVGEYIENSIARELKYNQTPIIHHHISDLIINFTTLDEKEKDFIANYLESFGRDLQHNTFEHLNLLELYESCNCNNYSDFVIFLLNKCYTEDNYVFISEICSFLRGNLPINNTIRDILIKSVLDINKSNRLRERIFWIFNYDYKNDSIAFYTNDFEKFLIDNLENIELNSDIIEFFHWNTSYMKQVEIEKVKSIINNYFSIKPEIKLKIRSSITKNLLEKKDSE